jgi:hypothetical protein
MTEILLTQTTFVGLLVDEAELPKIPAELWPLEGAIELLAEQASGGRLAFAAQRWLAPRPGPRGRVSGLARWTREASRAGLLEAEGEGWSAGYRPAESWLSGVEALRDQLDSGEREALAYGAQRLVAMVTMLSKNAVA